jgi:predicted O-methyltransferase YrrM
MKEPEINKVCHTIRDTIDIIVENCPNNAILVESGTYWGNTAAFMVNKLVQAGKTFKLYTIDNFLWENVVQAQKDIDRVCGYEDYLKNVENLGVEEYIITIVGDTLESISLVPNDVYCVFIDDKHEYTHVKNQIKTWLPKIMKGGIMIGDDYVGGVKLAFDEEFGDKIRLTGRGGCIIYL